jgi:excisionase family DNA binding protein
MALRRIPEVARELDVSVPRAYALVREGLLPAVRLGRQVRVSEAALRRFISDGGKGLSDGCNHEQLEAQREGRTG